ncbi:hypothetical protein H2202_004332 [Exophiala xenobiotica]|nr:hypothetical protein H2202_004332 [Exophiala xenobiotica]KAK5211222.1 hypothetical protein LTR41_002681 [Exophiala xenobiotica]KAK5218775.1 hypothetical protein LTR72_008715 [Exophiala xenobiotica]KAK5229164.1 hypothetical protein LTR47_008056 [Exophiala xenobiotica]KAK5253084.1 hypothetical protein LTS06_002543 [Exophiala xenobiotica]
MAGIAAAYQHEGNDAWLNQVVSDIIDSASIARPSSRSRSRSLRSVSRSTTGRWRDASRDTNSNRAQHVARDIAGDDAGGTYPENADAATFVTARSEVSRGRRPNHSLDRTISQQSCLSGASSRGSGRNTSQSVHTQTSPPAYSQRPGHGPMGSLSIVRPESRAASSGNTTHGAPNFPETTYIPSRYAPRTPKVTASGTMAENVEASSDARSVRFDDKQRWSEPPQRRLSTVSEYSEFKFESHPAVRPLENRRKVLGEAAGPAAEDDPTEYPGPLPLALIVLGICLSVFIISLDRNIITTAIPNITARFHSYDDIGWYGSAYLLTASAFQPLYGRIYMSFNTKSSFLVALVIFEIGSLIAAISPSSKTLIVGRAIQGVGSAGLLTGAFVVATHSVRLQHRPVLFAAVGILYGVGALCGPLLGGAFTDTIGWRWCFYINLPMGTVTFVAVFFCFKRRSPSSSKAVAPLKQRILQLDIIGNIILLGATTMLFLALQFSESRYKWSSARCVGLLCGFGVTTLLFIAWMLYRGDAALIPARIVRQRTVAASCGAAFMIYGALLLHSYYLPIWFQAIRGTSAIHSGVNMIPYMVANAFFSLLAGIFVSKNGLFAPPAILGCAIGTIGSGLLATLNEHTSSSKWIAYEFLISAGLGMAIQQGFSAVQAILPLEEVPIGTAAVVASQSLGGAIFVSVGNTLLQNHLLNANHDKAIPGVNVRAVFELGATRFRDVVPAEDLPALIKLYNDSLQAVFIAAVPLCGVAFICSLCMEWKSLKVKPGAQTRGKKDPGLESGTGGSDSERTSTGHDSERTITAEDSARPLTAYDSEMTITAHDSERPITAHDSGRSSTAHDSEMPITAHDSEGTITAQA